MKNTAHILRVVFVVAYVLVVLAFIGCAPKQDVIHSNVLYQNQTFAVQNEVIPGMRTPLSAPRMVPETAAETITLICEFQAN